MLKSIQYPETHSQEVLHQEGTLPEIFGGPF